MTSERKQNYLLLLMKKRARVKERKRDKAQTHNQGSVSSNQSKYTLMAP